MPFRDYASSEFVAQPSVGGIIFYAFVPVQMDLKVGLGEREGIDAIERAEIY